MTFTYSHLNERYYEAEDMTINDAVLEKHTKWLAMKQGISERAR